MSNQGAQPSPSSAAFSDGESASHASGEWGRSRTVDESRALVAALEHANATVTNEVDEPLVVVEGQVPRDLRGVLFRNGPGRMEMGGVPYGHLFDGDGMVTRFAFTSDGVRYRNRYVRTREYLEETRAGRILYRGFGTNRPGGFWANALRMDFKNAANTSVVSHGGKLLALWEGGLPHRLDPITLDTLARDDYDGQLVNRFSRLDRMLAPELPFSAHPKIDSETGELFNFGTLFGPVNRLVLTRVASDGKMAAPEVVRLARLAFVHDFVLTRSWRIFFLMPVTFGVLPTLLGTATPAASMRQDPGALTEILLVPRDGGEPVRLHTRACFIFHFAGAWEEPNGRILVDGMRLEGFPDLSNPSALLEPNDTSVGMPRLTRYVLDPAARTVAEVLLCEHPGELPTIHPDLPGRPHRWVWAIGSGANNEDSFFTALVKMDAEKGAHLYKDFSPDFPGEAVFVPRANSKQEDDGWVLTLVYRSREHVSELVILDGIDLSIVCRLRLPHHVPPGFHGTWIPDQSL